MKKYSLCFSSITLWIKHRNSHSRLFLLNKLILLAKTMYNYFPVTGIVQLRSIKKKLYNSDVRARLGITKKNVTLSVTKLFIYPTMIFFGVLAALPVYLVIVNITRSTAEINSGISLLPSVHLADNWRILNSTGLSLARGFFNSFFIASLTSLCATYSSTMAAYGVHMYTFRGRRMFWGLIMFIMMLPLSLSYIGFFRLVFAMRLLDSYIPLIIPAIASPVVVFFLRQYLLSLPVRELADVSRIDGAGEFWTFNAIVLPIMVPALCMYIFTSRFIIAGLMAGSLKE